MFDLAAAKVHLNIPVVDVTKDAAVQLSLDTAMALAEKYCNRKFNYAVETATFHYPFAQNLQLSRYPIEQVASVTSDATIIDSDSYQVVLGVGQIKSRGWLTGKSVDVTYAGGYKVLPADLLLALWRIFDVVWASTPAGGSGGAVSGQTISSITIPDVGTIRYESSGAAGSSSAGAAGGLIDSVAASILSLYRLEIC